MANFEWFRNLSWKRNKQPADELVYITVRVTRAYKAALKLRVPQASAEAGFDVTQGAIVESDSLAHDAALRRLKREQAALLNAPAVSDT